MIVFIIGCARSGTSILGELIGSHPDTTYIGEQGQAMWHQDVTTGHHRMTEADITPERMGRLRWYFDHKNKILVEKCPPNILRLPFIKEVFPEAKFIHIARDGRDVACSLIPGVGGKNWMHLKPPNWADIMVEYEGLERCAHLWRTVMEIGLDDFDSLDIPHLTIRYEDLVHYPEPTAKTICQYLGLSYNQYMRDFAKTKIQNPTKGSYHAAGQVTWFRDDHYCRVKRWVENIPVNKWEAVNEICQPILHRLRYEI